MTASYLCTVYTPGGSYRQSSNCGGEIDPQCGVGCVNIDRVEYTAKVGEVVDTGILEGVPAVGIDNNDTAHILRTDEDGNLSITTEDDEKLTVQNFESENLQEEILRELKKMNIHLQSITDERILDVDIEEEYV